MPPTAGPDPAPIAHYENFPVASWLCPRHLRAPIAAIYHFARTADDLADEGVASPEQRLADLAAYRRALHQAGQGPMPAQAKEADRWPQVFGPLSRAIAEFALPTHLLHALLDAFEHDVHMTRDGGDYPDMAALLAYCTKSANPVGRLLLHLYGVQDARSLQRSDAVCTALQLINFWQDPSRDLATGRNYFPRGRCQSAYGTGPGPGAPDTGPRRLGTAPGGSRGLACAGQDRSPGRRGIAHPSTLALVGRAAHGLARALYVSCH